MLFIAKGCWTFVYYTISTRIKRDTYDKGWTFVLSRQRCLKADIALPIIQDSLFLNDSACWYIQKDRAKYHIIRRWNSRRRVVSTPRSADKHEQEAETADFSLPLTLYISLSLFLSSASAPSPRSSASLDCWLLPFVVHRAYRWHTRLGLSVSTLLDSTRDSTRPRLGFFRARKETR